MKTAIGENRKWSLLGWSSSGLNIKGETHGKNTLSLQG